MKKLLLTIISSAVIASSVSANSDSFSSFLNTSPVKAVKLYDGRRIDIKKEVENLYTFNSKIDYLELFTGEIVDRTDIQSLQFVSQPITSAIINETMFLAKLGVDGGG